MMTFFKSVKDEMHNVTWPTIKQNRNDMVIVVLSTILFASFLGLADLIFSQIIQNL